MSAPRNPNRYLSVTASDGEVRVEGREFRSDRRRDDGNSAYLDLTPRQARELAERLLKAGAAASVLIGKGGIDF